MLAVVAAVIYGNYRLVRFALAWLGTGSIGEASLLESPVPNATDVSPDLKNSEGHDLPGLPAVT